MSNVDKPQNFMPTKINDLTVSVPDMWLSLT